MIALIKAELRKNWKSGRFLVAFLCFLIFMSCAYIYCLQKDQEYYDDETMNIHYENTLVGDISQSNISKLQWMPKEEEPLGFREKTYLLLEASDYISSWANYRQAVEYFGYDKVTNVAYLRSKSLVSVLTNKYYDNELEGIGLTLSNLKDDVKYYGYMKDHDISMYHSPYEPNLLNFIIQLFQNEMMILLIMVSAFFLIDQICQDFDNGSYKNIYAMPVKRSAIMGAKVISSLLMISVSFIIAFVLFAWIPFTQHGLGITEYPYRHNHELLTYIPLLMKVIPFVLVQLLFYMSICMIAATLFKNTTNTLLFMAGVLLMVYLGVQFFGLHNPWITWLPFFYIYPFDVIFGSYDYSYWFCMVAGLVSVVALFVFFWRKLEHVDLKGSDAS